MKSSQETNVFRLYLFLLRHLIVYGEIDSLSTLIGNQINGKMYNAIFNVYSDI